ncbi:MAG: hypothetical protein C4297_09065 [Gemmataceae bacterium]
MCASALCNYLHALQKELWQLVDRASELLQAPDDPDLPRHMATTLQSLAQVLDQQHTLLATHGYLDEILKLAPHMQRSLLRLYQGDIHLCQEARHLAHQIGTSQRLDDASRARIQQLLADIVSHIRKRNQVLLDAYFIEPAAVD